MLSQLETLFLSPFLGRTKDPRLMDQPPLSLTRLGHHPWTDLINSRNTDLPSINPLPVPLILHNKIPGNTLGTENENSFTPKTCLNTVWYRTPNRLPLYFLCTPEVEVKDRVLRILETLNDSLPSQKTYICSTKFPTLSGSLKVPPRPVVLLFGNESPNLEGLNGGSRSLSLPWRLPQVRGHRLLN